MGPEDSCEDFNQESHLPYEDRLRELGLSILQLGLSILQLRSSILQRLPVPKEAYNKGGEGLFTRGCSGQDKGEWLQAEIE